MTISYESYKERYLKAYGKYKGRINLLDPAYDDARILEAFNNYTNPNLWCRRSFRPGTLAESNVEYYDYLILNAIHWYYSEWISNENVQKMCREQPDEIRRIVELYGKRNEK